MIQDRLKELREDLDLKQEDVAIALNVTRSTYGGWELGRAEPSISMLLALSKFYNVSIDYLCCNTPVKCTYYKDENISQYVNECIKVYNKFLKK